MIALGPHPLGVILPVRASPGAKSSSIRGVHQGRLKVSVTQVAEKGKANKAIIALLARALSLKRSQLELIGGAASPEKKFLVRDISREELSRRIEVALEGSQG